MTLRSLVLAFVVAACGPPVAPVAPTPTPTPTSTPKTATPEVSKVTPGKVTGMFAGDECTHVSGTPEAVASFQKACTLKDGDGCLELAARYQCGAGVARDVDKALQYDVQACDLANGGGCANAAMAYLGATGDPAKALEYANKGCMLANGVACGYVGVIYWQGIGVPADLSRAAKIFDDQCVKKSNMMACANYAVLLYMGGDGVARDLKRAKELAETSCLADMQAACNILAGILIEQGGDDNAARAAQLFEQVCTEGGGGSCDNLGELYLHGAGKILPDRAKAKTEFERACQLQNALGCTHLGDVTSGP
jgi:uncharacterized protein